MSEELKLALNALNMKLLTDKLTAENEAATMKTLQTVIESLLPYAINAIQSLRRSNAASPSGIKLTLTREELLFFANNCSSEELEAIINDLTSVLKNKGSEE